MRRSILTIVALLLLSTTAYADKLAPAGDKLQPLPPDVQPAVSENVQRNATPQDVQTVQQAANSEPAPDSSVAPTNAPIHYSVSNAASSNTGVVLIVIAIVVLLGIVGMWFWRAF